MRNPEVHQALIEGRRLVERRWIQHAGSDSHGGFCAQAAIYTGSPNERVAFEAWHALLVAIATLGEGTWPTIPAWNDMPHRTKADVLLAFDKAIELSAPPEQPVREVAPVQPVANWQPITVRVEVPPNKTLQQRVKELVGV